MFYLSWLYFRCYYFTDKDNIYMKNNINILGNNQTFPYIVEYSKNTKSSSGHNNTDGDDILWCIDNGIIRLFNSDVNYYRIINEWYNVNKDTMNNSYIPYNAQITNIKLYIPTHSISTYTKSIKYAVTINTWINGKKIDLGTHIFRPTDTYAIPTGVIKCGNNEYYECIDFDIIDPFYLLYSDNWLDFRHIVCDEPYGINNTSASIQVSLFVVDEYDDHYILKNDYIGGCTSFVISDTNDYLELKLLDVYDPLGIELKLKINSEYDSLSEYLSETYGIVDNYTANFDIVIKNKNSIIVGPSYIYNANETFGELIQYINWDDIDDENNIKTFFSNWLNFTEGWNLVASLSIIDSNDDFEMMVVVSNELPITQEIFSRYINGCSEKIIDLEDMNVSIFNVVNKIENKIVQIDRPNESKSNIIQPVFFRVKDTEILTLHPVVTENISINLDDYKSKVDRFTLMIGDCKFEQIGSNNYGVLFKITGNTIPNNVTSGIYYILDENKELVTTGKFNCIR